MGLWPYIWESWGPWRKIVASTADVNMFHEIVPQTHIFVQTTTCV